MNAQQNDTLTADEYVDHILAETRANVVKALAVRAEIDRGGDYERGRLQARNVMRTLGFNDAAVADLEALSGSAYASRDYLAGYQYEVLAAAGRP